MPRVQGEEQDYDDNPDGDGIPEIVPENIPHNTPTPGSPKSPYLFSIFQQEQKQQQQQQQRRFHHGEEKKHHQQSRRNSKGGFTNGMMGGSSSMTSSANHFDRLRGSASQVNFFSSKLTSPVSADVLNDTIHLTKGRGVLANMRDVNVSPVGK